MGSPKQFMSQLLSQPLEVSNAREDAAFIILSNPGDPLGSRNAGIELNRFSQKQFPSKPS
jgi:hypothetical protein